MPYAMARCGSLLAAISSLYRTAPVGLRNQPDFINAVVALDTD
jgi:2-amino-4-hydroxy-6-hydroxymethyldihydropteridine diphosphokinase